MGEVHYAVTATLPSAEVAEEYARWLAGGHVDQVVAGGARSAIVVRLDPAPGSEHQVETVYVFPSREVFATYEREHAPALRKEGLAKFGPERGVRFARRVGAVTYRKVI